MDDTKLTDDLMALLRAASEVEGHQEVVKVKITVDFGDSQLELKVSPKHG